MKLLKTITVDDKYNDKYKEYCEKHNANIFLPMALGVLCVEIIILIFQLIRLKELLFDLFYFKVYILAIIISAIFSVVYTLYRRKKISFNQEITDQLFVFSYIGLAVLTSYAEMVPAQTLPKNLILSTMMIVVALIAYFSYKKAFTYLFIATVSAALLAVVPYYYYPYWNISLTEVFASLLDLLFVLVATLFACVPSCNAKTNMFLQERALEEANIQLTGSNKELESMNKQLEKNSTTDALTEVSNRLAFNLAIKREWNNAKLLDNNLAALMIDVDFFKEYNDAFGHVEGDNCLKLVATTITKCVRNGEDKVFRYGGEEFAVLLPHTKEEGAVSTAKRIQKEIEKLAIKHITQKKIVSVSIGICSEKALVNNEYSIIEKADKALYKAKANGRDRHEVYSNNS